MTGTTGIAGITTILRKKSRRTKTTRATTDIIKEVDATRIVVRRTNVPASMGLTGKIVSIETNESTTKIRTMTGTRSRFGTNNNHHECSKE